MDESKSWQEHQKCEKVIHSLAKRQSSCIAFSPNKHTHLQQIYHLNPLVVEGFYYDFNRLPPCSGISFHTSRNSSLREGSRTLRGTTNGSFISMARTDLLM
ncbi:hypothetical protein [Desulfosporosinus burensis]